MTCIMSSMLFAQAPNSFNFQAVARNAAGEILKNQNVTFRISILQTTSTGTTMFQETHSLPTNQYGLVTGEYGGFNYLKPGRYYMKVAILSEQHCDMRPELRLCVSNSAVVTSNSGNVFCHNT